MPQIELETLLKLVGTLSDSTDPGSSSARFRDYLRENLRQIADVRAYVNDALAQPGDQYNKALQDLINHIGQLLEFNVVYGRYRGVPGQIGFDGLWHSQSQWALVVETKTTDVYTVRTDTLLGYINALVSDGQIDSPGDALGLYVYGRFDAGTNQLENAIIAEGRRQQLRVISVDALLNLLELKQEYDLDHQTILSLLLPAPIRVDPLVNLIFDVVSQEKRETVAAKIAEPRTEYRAEDTSGGTYYSLPASDSEDGTPVLENLHRWLEKGLWGLGQRTGYRKSFAPGDRVCFYAARTGVVAEATVASPCFDLSKRQNPSRVDVPYAMRLENVHWFDDPMELTTEVRGQLDAFEGRDLDKGWAWFVQGTSKLTEHDFGLLTGRMAVPRSVPQEETPLQVAQDGSRTKLVSISEDYRGKKVRAIVVQGKKQVVSTWKDAMLALFEWLRRRDPKRFEQTAVTMRGRKRPYISPDKTVLRMPGPIPNTSLYVETNLSANSIVKLCSTLLVEMGYSKADLAFETE